MTLWKNFRDVSVGYYQEPYTRLNIKFDKYAGESQVSLNSEAITEVESVLKDRDVYEEQDVVWVIDFDKHGGKKDKHGEKKLGTYLLRSKWLNDILTSRHCHGVPAAQNLLVR